jgi:hypothetical protein
LYKVKSWHLPGGNISYYRPWTGTYLTDQVSHQPTFFSFVVYPDGSLLIKSKGVPPAHDITYAQGSWVLTGNTFTYTDTTVNYSITLIQSGKLTFSNSGTMTGGTWKDISDGGVFYTRTYPTMARVN